MKSVVAEPLDGWRKQNVPARRSTGAPARTPGVAGTARQEGKTLNVGDLARSGWPEPVNKMRQPGEQFRLLMDRSAAPPPWAC